ncbi:MAG: SIMPL domain-containing protein [Caldilineaceae bacterium]
MKSYRLQTLIAGLTIAALIILGSWGKASPTIVHAQTADDTTTPPRTITVVGEGKVSIKPDTAQANIGVEVVKPTVKEASAENKQIFETMLAALKEQGIAEKDIQTSGFNIWAERTSDPGSTEMKTLYHVTNNVTVIIRDLDKVGNVLDAAIEAGANNIYGVNFSLDKMDAAQSQAREAAIQNANAKAEELAQLTNVKVGEVVSVSEVIGGGYPMAAYAMQSGLGGGAAPISPGELQVTLQVQVTYMIAQ